MSVTPISLILWRTPRRAEQHIHDLNLPAADWRDRITPWLPVPRWAYQQPLLVRIMRLPLVQRYALLQLVYPHQLGAQRNPRMLMFALHACARTLFPMAGFLRAITPRCAQYEPLLASGQTTTMRHHLRRCAACQQRARLLTMTRHAVVRTITTMQLPTPTRSPMLARWLAVMISLLVIVVGFVLPLATPQRHLHAFTQVDVGLLLQRAEATLYQPGELDAGMQHYQQYDIFWKFADGSVTTLNAELWYRRAPAQYRAQLTHPAGGSPFELDIASQAFRFYGVSAAYAPDIWPPHNDTIHVIMPMGVQQPIDARIWRLHQGAWGVPWRVFHQLRQGTEPPTVVGTAFALDGTPLVRIQQTAWWVDVDPESGRLYAIWSRAHDGAQLRWRLRVQQQIAHSKDGIFVVAQRQYADVVDRDTPALHPALPLIPAASSAQRRGDMVEYALSGKRCSAVLTDTFVAHCIDTRTGRESVYTVGSMP